MVLRGVVEDLSALRDRDSVSKPIQNPLFRHEKDVKTKSCGCIKWMNLKKLPIFGEIGFFGFI